MVVMSSFCDFADTRVKIAGIMKLNNWTRCNAFTIFLFVCLFQDFSFPFSKKKTHFTFLVFSEFVVQLSVSPWVGSKGVLMLLC